jgi:hypothetical protein
MFIIYITFYLILCLIPYLFLLEYLNYLNAIIIYTDKISTAQII